MTGEGEFQGAAEGKAAPDASEGGDRAGQMEQELQQERARGERLLANWQRAQADLANLRKQFEREREELVKLANGMLMADVLPVVDDLERALENVTPKLRGFTWIDGVWFIYQKLLAVLQAHGLSPVKAMQEPFDPQHHQAVGEGEGPEGVVVEEVQRGYKLHDRALRPALVKVGRGRAAGGDKGSEQAGSAGQGQ